MAIVDNTLVVKYNLVDLHIVPGLTITNREVNMLPDRNLRTYKLARADGSITTTAEYTTKKIIVGGIIIGVSRQVVESSIDTLRGLLASNEGEIDIVMAGTTRRFIGTLSSMTNDLIGGYCTFTLEFTCASPVGSDTTTTTLLASTANTAAGASYSISVGGSYRAEPYITITYSAITGGTGATVEVYNAADNIGLSITRTWVSGDVLEIDNYNKTVLVNGVSVARSGRFFYFPSGANDLGYSDNMTTRTMTIAATYTRRYV